MNTRTGLAPSSLPVHLMNKSRRESKVGHFGMGRNGQDDWCHLLLSKRDAPSIVNQLRKRIRMVGITIAIF